MPDIALLEPTVLNGVIQRMPPSDGLLGHQIVGRQPWPDTSWAYDIITRRRRIARPNTPNSAARIVDQNGVGRMSGGFLYTREKKVFSPTTIRWLRAPGEMARPNAEAAVLREMGELTERVDRLEEYCIWQMLGRGQFDLSALGYNTGVIDYGVDATHQPTVATFWNSPAANIVTDLQDFKRIISRDSDAVLTNLIGNGITLDTFYRHTQVNSMLSDSQKNSMVVEGKLPRFQQIDFEEYDRGFEDDYTTPGTPTFRTYIADGYFVGVADGGVNPNFALLDGPAADHDAPTGHTGRFSKTWREADPSELQGLLESNWFPVLFQPDHLLQPRVF